MRTITPTPGVPTATSGVPTATPSATDVPATATEAPVDTATPADTAVPTTTAEPTDTVAQPTNTVAPPTNTIAPPTSTPTAIMTGTAATFTPTPVMTGTAATFTPTPVMTGTAATQTPTPTPDDSVPTATSTRPPGAPALIGSIHQIYITDLMPGSGLVLMDPSGTAIATGEADGRGSYAFRGLDAGDGYTVQVTAPSATTSAAMATVGPVTVLAMNDHPHPSTYEGQEIGEGYGYLRTRDGTLLAINVVVPAGVTLDDGPFPTLIEYSGYDPANPNLNEPGVLIGPLIGFVTVGVNMRGTGCSGGAFDYFEPAQSTDGYDAIEVIARQPWVKGGKVGMIGISYPGISQLFTAQLQPPHLAAIAPLSVISETPSTLYPGGILNNGFAVDWAADRQRDAQAGGQRWSRDRMDEGDQICIDNQKLKDQAPDIFQQIEDNPYYTEEIAAPLSPVTFVDRINVPVFLAGAWQDEQTGGHFPTMLDRFTGHDNVHFTITNGGHTDSLGPLIFARMFEFYTLYVADEVREFPALGAIAIAEVGRSIFGVTGIEAPPPRFVGMSLEDARSAFEADPKVRILFDNGAGSGEPGAPYPGFEMTFSDWPVPEVVPTRFYFTADGGLAGEVPGDSGELSYDYNPDHSQELSLDGGSSAAWRAQPDWHWDFVSTDDELVFTSDALADDTVMVGSASVDLWLKSTAMDTDLQVTLSEVRPDGFEVYIQNGWLRAARRVLDESRSSELRPVHTHLEVDEALLPPGEFVSVRVEMFPFAHAFRAGSKIRIAVGSPGESRVLWKYDVLPEDGDVVNSVGYGSMYPSSVVLPVVDGATVPTDYPAATSLRAQPARSVDVTSDS